MKNKVWTLIGNLYADAYLNGEAGSYNSMIVDKATDDIGQLMLNLINDISTEIPELAYEKYSKSEVDTLIRGNLQRIKLQLLNKIKE